MGLCPGCWRCEGPAGGRIVAGIVAGRGGSWWWCEMASRRRAQLAVCWDWPDPMQRRWWRVMVAAAAMRSGGTKWGNQWGSGLRLGSWVARSGLALAWDGRRRALRACGGGGSLVLVVVFSGR
ncbi:hypothetical protein Droror1_Dr00021155, partial [Drosera rotundifolia]